MMKNRKLARKIGESAWSSLVTMIEYKASWYGKTFHKIDRFFPSSKTCSSCSHTLIKLDLGTREWTCPVCGTNHDRDENAAINIQNQGQIDCYGSKIPSDAITEVGEIPVALKKHSTKIEKSRFNESSWNGERASLMIFSR